MNPKLLKILSFLVRILGVFLILFTLMAFGDAFLNLLESRELGGPGFDQTWLQGSDSLLVITIVQNESPAFRSGIIVGDTIVKINGQFYNKQNYQQARGDPRIGKKFNISIRRGNQSVVHELEFVPLSFYEKFLELLFRMVPTVIMLLYIIVGYYGLFKSPYSQETLTIAMFCFCFGCFMYSVVGFSTDLDTVIRKYIFFKEIKVFVLFISMFATCFWLLLFATFPKRFTFFDHNKTLSYIFIFLLPILVVISTFFKIPISAIILFPLLLLNMIIGIFLLKFNIKKIDNALQLRQVRLMFLGIKYGAVAIISGWAIVLITQTLFGDSSSIYNYIAVTYFLVSQIGGLIIPFTFLNSFFQNRLLETESALRRRIRYIGVTIALLIFYLSIIFTIGRIWINIFSITDPTLIIIFVLFISLTFTPFNKKILKWLDEKFYPEKTKYVESLKQFIQNISSYLEQHELLNQLSDWTIRTIGISSVVPVAFTDGVSSTIPFSVQDDDSIINRIKDGKNFFWDEITERSRISVSRNELNWAKNNDISLTIPMMSHGELIGLLNVGKKTGEDDFTAEDLDILTQAASQTALALQNLKLQGEYIEKKRMGKELEMARNIQKRLMPQTVPNVPGLEITGECHPCNEIAGDYFDIINIEGGFTAIVVADVSGKGAGAAMIMANLQASIRLGVHLSDKLAEFVSRINDLIYGNTSPSEFITFFMGLWDPEKKVLYYVNAGHNPPVLVAPDGTVTRLEASGLILGILPEQEYEEKYILLKPGSVFVIYTDGLEEAMNKKEELYGDERIINTIKSNLNTKPDSIIQALSDDVLKFCDGIRLHDDVTLIVGKVTES